ncbi:MAG: flagellar hook-length control protein FliK [Sedimentisphaerales bacterium]|nr:flagellar hook-length control protein FliK [Sedimentisphaerales bacterium]
MAQAPSKEGSFSDSKEGLKEQADGSMPSGNGPAAFSQRISVQTPGTSGFEGATPKSGSQSVSDQILDSVRASLAGGEKQVMVRLNPPELGAVTVRFQEQGDQIRAVLEVSRNETRQEVERAIPEVLRTLQESGVQIRRVEVILSDQSGKDLGKDQLQQDAWAQQQTSQQHAGNPQAPFATGWSSQTRATRSSAEPDGTGSQGVTSTSGINLLI